ncbi:hypothetical protein GCM10010269_12900 [Streptomyces humidus]|uniref:Integral membrane protein n=1 Tax=Streptomyces humidus TaxID=52259 RepID=A0A918L268_9ACTN|nr:hypothetical protein [Streptomyces humidus]GGR75130.1 hypothetical protein GCM10010269_12900 [Streptomyces humidus]
MTAPYSERSGRDLRLLRAAVFAAVCVLLAAAAHSTATCAVIPLWTLGAGFLGVLAVVAPLAGRERSLPGIAALLAVGQTALHTLFGLGQHTVSGSAALSADASATLSGTDATLVARAARLVCGATAAALSPAEAQKILVNARLYPAGAGAGAGSGGGTTAMSGMTGMGSMRHPTDVLSAAGSPISPLPSLPMLLGHVLAAVAAGWLLRRGDTALLRLLALSAHGVAEGALVRSLRGALALVRALLAGLPTAPGAGPRVPCAALLTPAAPRITALQHSVIRRGPPHASALALAA